MRRTVGLLCLFVALSACLALAAPDSDTMLRDWPGSGATQPYAPFPATGSATIADRPQLAPLPGSDSELLLKMQEEQQLKLLQEGGPDAAEADGQPSQPGQKDLIQRGKADRQKPQVLLTAEPGDGLAKLAWKVLNLPVRTDEQPLRFMIRYGIESEKLTRTIQVGPVQDYVLRELKNYQPYYLQVVAMDREQLVLYKSEELRTIPLPFDAQGSRIEQSFSRKPLTLLDKNTTEPFERELKQFGYDFFRNSPQLSQAVDSLPAGDEYLVGPGDVLKLTIWGAVNAQQDLQVDRNGEVLIPKVGSVKVWGLTFAKAKETINSAIGRYFRNYEMNLSMGRLRTIQVYVVGEVEAPGSYPVSSMATVINALAAAGGPSRNGSLRAVRVTRPGQAPQPVDLYEMLLSGDRSKDVRLQNGDTIFVPVIGPVAAVAGEVRRPAIYELLGTTTLPELLQMAGGLSATAYTGRIQVERLADNHARIVQDYSPAAGQLEQSLAKVEMRDRDMVKVFPVQAATRQVVSLKGNIQRPGEYQFKPDMRLTDLIPSTQLLLPESYLDAVEITRLSPPDYRKELLTANLRSALAGNAADNILLQEQDTIKVFSRWEMEEKPKVAVNGAVVNPGVYEYQHGMAVRDLVAAGGSPKRNAYLDQAELSRISVHGDKAEHKRIQLDLGKALAGDPQHNLSLQPDDVLIVRSVANWQDATNTFVRLKGEVRFPGVYTVARGEKLSSVIARAGGYTENAYLFGAKFTRRSVQQQQQKRMDEIIVRTEKDIMQKQASLTAMAASKEELEATKTALDGLLKSLEQMRRIKAEGRVVMRLAQLDEFTKSSYDIELEGGDEVEIPQRPGVVHVLGQVYNQTSFVYLPDTAYVGDYLAKAGGPTREAEEDEIYIIKADGSVFSRQQSSFGIHWNDDSKSWSFGSFMASPLMPGDTVVVPQKIERVAWMRELKDITQILANIAVAAGTVWIGLK